MDINNYCGGPMSSEKIKQHVATQDAAMDATVDSKLKELHTALPGIIVAFDAVKQTASVQSTISRVAHDDSATPLPLCVDVPVHFPGGSGYVLTFPVAPGDECLLVFSERAIDGWFESGEVTPPTDYRLHDLSDGFALVGFRSQPKKITNFSTSAVELRSEDASTKISLSSNGGIVNQTPGGSTVLTNDGQYYINAPGGIILNGQVLLIGSMTSQPGNGGSGEATFDGIVTAQDVISGTISGKSHTHSNPEGGSVGAPQ